jgi:hypothetical protein
MKPENHSPLGAALLRLAECHMGAKDLKPLTQQECGFILELIADLNGRISDLEPDAERYRWIRGPDCGMTVLDDLLFGKELDETVDAEIAAPGEESAK